MNNKHDDDYTEIPDAADPFPQYKDSWWSKLLVVVFVVLPLAAAAFGIWSFWGVGVGWLELGLLLGMWGFTGLGISLGFHRMLTHRAFQARAPTRFMLLIAGTMSLQGPASDWAATHIRHHAKADRDGDPHSPLHGFWHAHMGWLLRDQFVRNGVAHDKLMSDPITRFVSKTWVLWATLGFLIPGAIAFAIHPTIWGFLAGMLWGGFIRVFLGHHITWSVNSLGHLFGTRPFRTTDKATNNFVVALLGWGEGWHNNHHAFPRSAFIGMRWYQVDIGRYALYGLKLLGQVKSVWLPSKEAKEAARIRRAKANAKATA